MPFPVTSRALALLLEGPITPDSPRHSQFLAWWCTDSPHYSQPFLAGSWSIQTAPEGAVLLPALLCAPRSPRSLEHKHVLLMSKEGSNWRFRFQADSTQGDPCKDWFLEWGLASVHPPVVYQENFCPTGHWLRGYLSYLCLTSISNYIHCTCGCTSC